MPRPSTQANLAMLASGRALYPLVGCAGLSVRKVAEHAGVRPGLFHYHFESKDTFLRNVLQEVYEDVFATLSEAAGGTGTASERLRQVLLLLGRFLREQGAVIGRIGSDVALGEPEVLAFVRANAPRHLALLTGLMDEAECGGQFAPMPPLRRMGFVMGAVLAPVIVGRGLQALLPEHPLLATRIGPDLLSDEAIATRVNLAMAALRAGKDTS